MKDTLIVGISLFFLLPLLSSAQTREVNLAETIRSLGIETPEELSCALMAVEQSNCGRYIAKSYRYSTTEELIEVLEATSEANAASTASQRCADQILEAGEPVDGTSLEDECPGCPNGLTGCQLLPWRVLRDKGSFRHNVTCTKISGSHGWNPFNPKPAKYRCKCNKSKNDFYSVYGHCDYCYDQKGESCEKKLKKIQSDTILGEDL